jgi:hypothetical protein
MTPVPSLEPIDAPSAPDTQMATLPIAEPKASDIPMAPQAAPELASAAEMPAGGVAEPDTTASASQMDPNARVQPVPSQPAAVPAKPKPTPVRSGQSGGAPKSEPVLQMRPTPDDDEPSVTRPKTVNARKTISPATRDNRGPESEPLRLRPTAADPPATVEASARN